MIRDFRDIASESVLVENGLAVAFLDRSPQTEGHALVVPKRFVDSYGDLEFGEKLAMWELVEELMNEGYEDGVKGWNVGFNEGSVAGQTVRRLHIHVIPRRRGDGAPKHGVRAILPASG